MVAVAVVVVADLLVVAVVVVVAVQLSKVQIIIQLIGRFDATALRSQEQAQRSVERAVTTGGQLGRGEQAPHEGSPLRSARGLH